MQYLRRALKFLVEFVIIFFLITGLIWLLTIRKTGAVSYAGMFEEGSLPKIILIFVAFAAIYPYLSFIKRKIHLKGPFAEFRSIIVEVFRNLGYIIEDENDKKMSFRMKRPADRISRFFEDRIEVTKSDNPLVISGYRRDLQRIVSILNNKLAEAEAGEETQETA